MSRLRESLAAWHRRAGVPAAGAAVLRSGAAPEIEVVGQRRRGEADPVTRADRWHIGSCGKTLTAALFGLLVEEGASDWEAPAADLFPDIAGVDPAWRKITMSEVLTHVAGLPANLTPQQLIDSYSDRRSAVEQRSEAVARALNRPARPGKFVYSNLGYIVAGAAIERLAGQPYESALTSMLLEPLGVRSAGFGAPTGKNAVGHRPRVRGILGRGRAVEACENNAEEPADNPAVMSPAGRLHLDLPDWAKLVSQFMVDGPTLLGSVTVSKILTPARGGYQSMGWAPVAYNRGRWSRVELAQQGSNRLWVATAILGKGRASAALVVCNDGRARMLRSTVGYCSRLL